MKINQMTKLIEGVFNHLSNWGTFWFGFLFWGSIFGATLLYILEAGLLISLIGYGLGLLFGLLAKNKGWSWIT